jgi:hypothetical protein
MTNQQGHTTGGLPLRVLVEYLQAAFGTLGETRSDFALSAHTVGEDVHEHARNATPSIVGPSSLRPF